MEKNLGKVSYLRLTDIGQIYLTDFLRGNIERCELAHQIAYLLAQIRRNQNTQGLSSFPTNIPNSIVLAYESALENKFIERVEGSFLDKVEYLIDKKWGYLEREEKESNFRAGLGPPPDIFGRYEDEEE